MKGDCPHCSQNVRLRSNGTMFKHGDCPGGIFSYPKYYPPLEPYYCDVCFWENCMDCIDESCQCVHWMPTNAELQRTLKTCSVCMTQQQAGNDGIVMQHQESGSSSYWRTCKGSYKPCAT